MQFPVSRWGACWRDAKTGLYVAEEMRLTGSLGMTAKGDYQVQKLLVEYAGGVLPGGSDSGNLLISRHEGSVREGCRCGLVGGQNLCLQNISIPERM
jgi:hypothetical protein